MKKWLSLSFYCFNKAEYERLYSSDVKALSYFGGRNGTLTKEDKNSIELKYLKAFRAFQSNRDNIWGKIFRRVLVKYKKKYGIDFGCCLNMQESIVIGHWGRIVINGNAKFGHNILLTHNVTIGADIRGKRAGTPTIGNYVCIRTNSTVVGNITIGDDVLIAPNTFVNFDVPSHSVVIGNPAVIHHKEHATEGHIS